MRKGEGMNIKGREGVGRIMEQCMVVGKKIGER